MQVRIDVVQNRLEANGRLVKGSHRWEALIVALLARSPDQFVSRAVLQAEMQRLGQRSQLDRTGFKRLLDGVERMLDALLGEGSFRQRVTFEPRHRTVGPWMLRADASITWEAVEGAAELDHQADRADTSGMDRLPLPAAGTCPLPTLATIDPDGSTGTFAPVELLFKADAMFSSGHLAEAAALLQTAGASRWITPEGWCVIQLRMARLLKRRGQYDEAEDLLSQILQVCASPGFPDPGLAALARHLRRRVRYDRRPVDFETLGADPLFSESSPLPDLRPLGEAVNLEALVLRRRAAVGAAAGRPQEARRLLLQAQRHMNAAMYWAASSRDHENCQNFAFNVGLINSALHELGDKRAAVAAFRAYRLGLQLREDFYVGRDSVWDHICIGKLWLGLPDRRAEFECELAFELPKLSEPQFYLEALAQARQLGETRQLALCCVNLWQFAKQQMPRRDSSTLMETARRHVQEMLQVQPELRETLRDDAPEVMADMQIS